MSKPKRLNKHWTERDDDLIRATYSELPVPAIAKQLERSEKATRTRIERLGIKLSDLERNKPNPRVEPKRKYLGWHYDSYGRKHISVKGRGSVAEHRYLVEQRIGRRLERTEHVHHINCDKKDNTIDNLHLFADAKSHMACHRSLEAVTKELMERGIVRFNSNTGRYEVCTNQP